MVRKYNRAPCAPDGLRYSKPIQLSKFAYVLSLIVSSILGCSHSKQIRADKPYYVTTVVQHKPFAEGQRKALIADILPRLQAAKLFSQRPQKQKRIPIKTETLAKIPLAELAAIWITVMQFEPGIEVDILVRLKKKTVPVQVFWDVHNRLTILKGKVNSSSPNTRPNPKISFKDGQRRWNEGQRDRVIRSTASLQKRTRQVLATLPLLRGGKSNAGGAHRAGHYAQKGCQQEIVLFDRAFTQDRYGFVGEPNSANTKLGFVIAHELGHAIHSQISRRLFCRLNKETRRFESLRKDYNRDVRKHRRGSDMTARNRAIEKLRGKLETLNQRALAAQSKGAVLAAFEKLLKGRIGPTLYGAEHLKESFAEAFALWSTDRAALIRIWPDVVAWFDSGRHWQLIRAELKR